MPRQHMHRLQFCNKAAGLAELFDSIACNIDASAFSDVEEVEDSSSKRPTRARKPAKTEVSSEEGSEGESNEDIVQRHPTFSNAPAPTRERISRSSKLLAQDKISKMADENTDIQRGKQTIDC